MLRVSSSWLQAALTSAWHEHAENVVKHSSSKCIHLRASLARSNADLRVSSIMVASLRDKHMHASEQQQYKVSGFRGLGLKV